MISPEEAPPFWRRMDEAMEFETSNLAQTQAVARELAARLEPGAVIALSGPMGAGKTAFCGGLAQGLGIDGPITSPTYTIVNEYRGRLPLFHFDLYRLGGPEDLYEIGWEDYLAREGVCVVEWPEIAEDELNPTITVRITPTGEHSRRITIQGGTEHANPGL